MNFRKFLFSAISVTFATAFFACSQMFAGSTETDNALANDESSSSGGTTEETNIHDTIPCNNCTETSSSSNHFGFGSSSNISIVASSSSYSIIEQSINNDNLIFNPPSSGGFGGGGMINCPDSTVVTQALENTIMLSRFISGRTEKLIETGLTLKQARTTAQAELFAALGIDSLLIEQPDQSKFISNLINYIFGGTVKSEFYKSVEATFTETGTLSKEHYCNFADRAETPEDKLPLTGYTGNGFPGHILYEYTMYNSRNCKGTLLIPSRIVEVVNTKCYDMPKCDSSKIGTTVKAKYNSAEKLFTCRASGWDGANAMEKTTFGIECDKEGKDVFYGGKPISQSFVCSLDSGWYVAETIDAETFDVPCDEHGKLYTNPDNPTKTYVCRKEPFCRHYDFYNADAPCMDEGWDYASKNDLEMAQAECSTDGQTQTSNTDPNMYYVCQNGKWSEFYNRPCDTDNKRIKIKAQNTYGYVEYICYDKTWRPTYEWHVEYPADYYFNPEINYGSFKDPRDNYVYHTINFKGRTWIAENMKYAGFSSSVLAKETRCLADSCKNVGRYYSINVAGEVCPDGWNLPDSSDIVSLGTRQPETEHLLSQLGGTGSNYSAPDTYGLSFILSGRIIDTDEPYSPWQGFSALLWMNETNEKKDRLVANISFYKVEFWGYYTNPRTYQNVFPDTEPAAFTNLSFFAVRCVKK
ncbi:MAG: hypothetical protein IK012_07755 [Fibrobacter sp.]|uniref:FISUMP domain-containing protein n=1 Tax=Fibrobacter sp. TaxID=35828 RepID=UPI0025C736E9|nr:FISUMP domain-containing protein [Fibrobacter sp.]MBR4785132.1 hypothetical protein [Fibrobacter sp.]